MSKVDPRRLVNRARQLVALEECPCVFSGLAAAKHEVELEQRTALTIAVAEAYDLVSETREDGSNSDV